MEATLKTDSIQYLRRILDTSFTHEETAEVIVPDSMPDILEIVDAGGTITLRGKQAETGRVGLSGTVDAAVIYVPEGESLPKKLELAIPFSAGCEGSEITEDSRVNVVARIASIDARMINSRKALVRVDVLVEAAAYGEAELSWASQVESGESAGLEVLSDDMEVSFVSQVREKTFVLSDEFHMPAGKPPIGEVLQTGIALESDDIKSVGNKLIFKGGARVHLLYTPKNGVQPETVEFTVSFSQIIEMDGEMESSSHEIKMMLTNFYVETGSPAAAEREMVAVELHIVAQAAAREKRTVRYISDIYSTLYEINDQRQQVSVESEAPSSKLAVDLRETVELPSGVQRVIDYKVYTGKVYTGEESGLTSLKTNVWVSVIYLTQEGRTAGLSRRMEASAALEPTGEGGSASADLGEGSLIVPVSTGLEIRIPVEFELRPSMTHRVHAVSQVNWDEECPKNLSELPSVVVHHAVSGETLWTMAKNYASTEDLILAANNLEEGAVPAQGQLLIIPKRR